MTEPQATPPPRPRWVWVILIGVVLVVVAVAVVHLLFGREMAGMHGALMVATTMERIRV